MLYFCIIKGRENCGAEISYIGFVSLKRATFERRKNIVLFLGFLEKSKQCLIVRSKSSAHQVACACANTFQMVSPCVSYVTSLADPLSCVDPCTWKDARSFSDPFFRRDSQAFVASKKQGIWCPTISLESEEWDTVELKLANLALFRLE